MIDGVELPDCDGNLETVLDHVERGERDDLRQAGLAHVDVHSDAVAARKRTFLLVCIKIQLLFHYPERNGVSER